MNKYNSFPLSGVTLLPGILKQRAELNRRYMMSLKNENLLQNHYSEAGLWNPAAQPEDCHWGWESPTSQLRGHYLGHWLSAAAKIYKATGDMELKAKADRIVSELAHCQEENGGEWVGSIPEKYLEWLNTGKKIWAPQYTIHKTLMGLYDMYEFTGNLQAMEVLKKAAKWFSRWTGRFSREELDKILDVETGGMLEVWADLYGATGEVEYLELMRRYDRHFLFDRLISGEDALSNMHMNTTIPEILGAARAYEVTGEKRWRDAVEAFWRCAVTERGYYCTGGQSSGEIWTEREKLAPRMGDETQELCTVYNMIRLAEKLMLWTGDVEYADYIERNLYNGILAQQNEVTGMPLYYLPIRPGAVKKWGTPTHDFWCCHGTLSQSYSRNEELIYYRSSEGIMVSQYFPSKLECELDGAGISIVQTQYEQVSNRYAVRNLKPERILRPDSLTMDFQIKCSEEKEFTMEFRMPWWIKTTPVITINGEAYKADLKPASFCSIRRPWKDDTVRIEFPKGLSCSPFPDKPDMAAVMYGPVVLAGLCGEERTLYGDMEKPEEIFRPFDEEGMKYQKMGYYTQNQEVNIQFMPLHAVTDEKYTIYFPFKSRK